jgi:hypothetical protein
MEIIESKIPFNYKTIKTTKSRIDKGLLAIPVSLIDYFPKNRTKVYIAFGPSMKESPKTFTPYTSSSRECRIGGMRKFYEDFQIKDGDELVIQILDEKKYRIFTERQFEESVKTMEEALDKSKDENEAGYKIKKISEVTNSDFQETVLGEYFRLSKNAFEKRKYFKPSIGMRKEGIPATIRKILIEIYGGKCQITQFGFLMRNGKPYFEIHHIKPELGNHLKNLLVVCPNIHALFTYAHIEQHFDEEGWLRRVRFNNEEYNVIHIIDKIPKQFEKEIHFL